ncbi:MAG: hypothetical protein LH631_07030 [Alkalinema sp. CAN_BIN05]|nr:hypothetical protein [Alkalinema sp. CAN_BIN05]
MTPNLTMIKPVFLPLTFICLGVFLGQMSAKAEPTNADVIQNQISPSAMPLVLGSSIDSKTEPPSIWRSERSPAQAIPNPAIQRKASSLGEPLTLTNRSATTSEFLFSSTFRLALSTTVPTYLGTDTVVSSTPTNPNPVNLNNNLPKITALEVTAPTSQTVPDATTPMQPLAQTIVSPGRSTQSGSSYVGIGGNIGIGSGDTALGRGSFAVISKIGLTRNFSVRPSVLFGNSTTILVPLTYDFNFGEGPTGDFGFRAAPYLGAGVAISTGNGSNVGLLLTGGIDVPLSSQFTATAAVNASLSGNTAVGILVGVGYNFR